MIQQWFFEHLSSATKKFIPFVSITAISSICFAVTPATPSEQPQPIRSATKSPITSQKISPTTIIDWTPVLKTMQNGCDLPDIENAPAEISASIVNDTARRNSTGIADGYKTLNLKNASAWGYPIKRIQYGSQGANFSSATIYFTDNRFMNLRSKFYVQTAAGKLTAQNRTIIKDSNAFAGQYLANGMGYNDGRSGVNFSQKTNSVTCSWAHL